MSSKVFVGGLAWRVNDQVLGEAFSPFGTILETKVVRNKDTGTSKGFGFITFDSASDAELAIEKMNGQTLMGRALRVTKAETPVEQSRPKPAPPPPNRKPSRYEFVEPVVERRPFRAHRKANADIITIND